MEERRKRRREIGRVRIINFRIIRPHRSTMYVDTAYSYRPSGVVCRSVCHISEPCRNGCTSRAAVWVEHLGAPGKPCIRWGYRSPHGKGQIFGGEWASHSANHLQQVSDLHLKFALRPHHKPQHENIYGLPYYIGRP